MNKEIVNNIRRFAHYNSVRIKQLKDNNYFRTSNEGKELEFLTSMTINSHNLSEVIEKIKSVVPNDKLISKLTKINQPKDLGSLNKILEEIDYLRKVIKDLKTQNFSKAVEHFIKEVKGYGLHIKKLGDLDTARKFLYSPFVKRILYYKNEVKELSLIHSNLEASSEAKNWDYFLKKFMPSLYVIARRFEDRYGDKDFSREVLKSKSRMHENHEFWKKFITTKLEEYKSFAYVTAKENEAVSGIINILEPRLNKLIQEKEQAEKEAREAVKERIITIDQERKKELHKRSKIDEKFKENLNRYGEFREVIDKIGKSNMKDKLEIIKLIKWRNSVFNWLTSLTPEMKKSRKDEVLKYEQAIEDSDEMEAKLLKELKTNIKYIIKTDNLSEIQLKNMDNTLRKAA